MSTTGLEIAQKRRMFKPVIRPEEIRERVILPGGKKLNMGTLTDFEAGIVLLPEPIVARIVEAIDEIARERGVTT